MSIFFAIFVSTTVLAGNKCRVISYPVSSPVATIVVCPGGSYYWLAKENEGAKVAEWLNANNISAYVLEYRTAGVFAFITRHRLIFRGIRYPDAQDDLRELLRELKESEKNPIGVMGFSAGGHLVMSSVELFEREDWPDFVVPVYPVVTMEGEYVHKRSRRALLGDNRSRNKDLREKLSLEQNLPDDCPPVFLVNCKDDPTVDYRNSVMLDSAMTAKNIEHLYMQYETGGHGFGGTDMNAGTDSERWKSDFMDWFNKYIIDGE